MQKFVQFLFFISFIFFSKEQNDYINSFFNIPLSKKDETIEPDDCLCNIDSSACNYLCCCDEKCDENTRNHWKERSKCIDEKDTVGIFSDRCIERSLIIFDNPRRGLKKEEATEDISNSNKVIQNYCFSMDNSKTMWRDIKTVSFTVPNSMKENNQIDSSGNDDQDYLSISNDNNGVFEGNSHFALYSGVDCNHLQEVEKFKNMNFTCSMSRGLNNNIKGAIRNNNIRINQLQCNIKSVYTITNGIINYKNEYSSSDGINFGGDEYIVEIEFIINMNTYDASDLICSINLVKKGLTHEQNFNFKNSVIFSKDNNNNNISVPYRYSGTNGYINGFPLKILSNVNDNNVIFNEFFIVGRRENGNCRIITDSNENVNSYLYDKDKPLLFNQDSSYKCNLNGNSISNTILYLKLNNIRKIAKYGDSTFGQINDDNYWVNIDNRMNVDNNENTKIKMNIYLGTKKIGVNSNKYVYKVILENTKGNNSTLSLDIKYYDLDKKSEYEEKPDYPAFIPSMPADLLDPLIYSQVDK